MYVLLQGSIFPFPQSTSTKTYKRLIKCSFRSPLNTEEPWTTHYKDQLSTDFVHRDRQLIYRAAKGGNSHNINADYKEIWYISEMCSTKNVLVNV